MNLMSSVNTVGKLVTQIIIFKDGITKTYHRIIASSIEDGRFCKMKTIEGRMIMVNTKNVLCIEVFQEDEN